MKYEEIPANVRQQYEALYGAFFQAEHNIGESIAFPGQSGEIVWSFRAGGDGPVTYAVSVFDAFPIEVEAATVYGTVSKW